jgi:phenylalanyl-tRNA synthetase beta subunit
MFLTVDEVRELTGYAIKAKQISQLKRMGIAFFINGGGRPIITVSAIEGRKQEVTVTPVWRSTILTENRKAA